MAHRAQPLHRRGVVALAFGQLEGDRQTVGVHRGMDLGRQSAARVTDATGPVVLVWVVDCRDVPL